MKSIYSKKYGAVVNQLKKARLESGLTQTAVSKKLKKPQSYISKIEQGERRVDIVELQILAEIYNKNLSYFVQTK